MRHLLFSGGNQSSDRRHDDALAWSDGYDGLLLTTAWILTEVADALARQQDRHAFGPFYQALKDDKRMQMVAADAALWERGLGLYLQRPDKDWSLTDCISFTVMQDAGLMESLTGGSSFCAGGFHRFALTLALCLAQFEIRG